MAYKHCPQCGGYLENVFLPEERHYRLKCRKCRFIFYQNSKPTASAIIVNKGKILLGKRKIEPSKGKWDVPGGFLELGEHPEGGILREVKEETGLKIETKELLEIFMDQYGSFGDATLNICYLAGVKSGKLKPGDDIEELKWFSVKELPSDMAFENGKMMLNAWLKKLGHFPKYKIKKYVK